jgi:hypothetical protein
LAPLTGPGPDRLGPTSVTHWRFFIIIFKLLQHFFLFVGLCATEGHRGMPPNGGMRSGAGTSSTSLTSAGRDEGANDKSATAGNTEKQHRLQTFEVLALDLPSGGGPPIALILAVLCTRSAKLTLDLREATEGMITVENSLL